MNAIDVSTSACETGNGQKPATLDDVLVLLQAMNQRMVRVETRMVRHMEANGLNADGSPATGQTDEVS